MSFHNFKSGCLICGNEIIVESKEVEHTCAICNKKFISSTICSNGHYVCDKCHSNSTEFINLLLNSKESDPTILFSQIENLPSVFWRKDYVIFAIPCCVC